MDGGELGYLIARASVGWLDSRVRAALLAWILGACCLGVACPILARLASRRRSRRMLVILGAAVLGTLGSWNVASVRTEALVRRDLAEVLRLPSTAASAVLVVGRARSVFPTKPSLPGEAVGWADEPTLSAWLADPGHAALLDLRQPPGAAIARRSRTEWRGAGLALVFGGPPGQVRSPQIARLGARSAEILWETVEPGEGAVRVVDLGAGTERVLQDIAPGPVHRATIAGLRPETAYAVRLEPPAMSARDDRELAFTTLAAPDTDAGRELRLAVVGDSGDGSSGIAGLVDAMASFRPAIVLHVGDLAYDRATPANLRERFQQPFEPLLRERWVWAVPGNHDICDGGFAWRAIFGDEPTGGIDAPDPWLLAVEAAGVRIVGFNSNAPPLPGSESRRALRGALGGDARWKIAFFHHPVVSHGREGAQPVVRALIAPLLAEARVDVAFSGHAHNYQRCSPPSGAGGGVHYVVTGGGGGDLDPTPATGECVGAARAHFVRLRVRADQLWLEAVEPDGSVLDRMMLRKADGAAVEESWIDPDGAEGR